MKQYTVRLTPAEVKAMEHEYPQVRDWIEATAQNRARKAINKIYTNEVERMNKDSDTTVIPANKEQVVLDANITKAADVLKEQELVKEEQDTLMTKLKNKFKKR